MSIIKLKIVNGAETMESIENKTIYLVETVLKQLSISVDIPKYIYGIEEAKGFLVDLIGNKSLENFYAIYMSISNEVVAISFIAKGDIVNVTMSIGEIIRVALLSNAKYIMVAHNHPSGIAIPSESDKNITKQIAKAAQLYNIHLIDSVIVCKNGDFCSIRKMVNGDGYERKRDSIHRNNKCDGK